ncbi:DUF1553 domain-containing protein [bacterium]|nr:DUF1553 domain-containing protein [bacterium]
MRIFPLSLAVVAALCFVDFADAETEFSPQHIEFFEKSVRPVLVKRCVGCHGSEKQEAGLRLDARSAVLKGSDSGEVVISGKPEESDLVHAIKYETSEMPPTEQLPPAEIAAIEKWVKLGLPWPEEAVPVAPLSFDQRLTNDQLHHWSYQPIQDPAPPAVDGGWAQNEIDHFVQRRLEDSGLSPSEKASRHTLIRRATFDLTGLPPTPQEVEAFEKDQSPNAFEKVIDRLLASPQYGVKWGRNWLDVARYSDTRGYLNDGQDRRFPYAHAYRDYVIDSFNQDTPYNEFIKEQLAADFFAQEGDRRLAGLGLIRIGRQFLKHQDTIDDRIDVVTRGILGLTVSCARCHDHKYDAINMADYYGLYGVFDQIDETMPLVGPIDSDPQYPEFKKKYDELQKTLDDHDAGVKTAVRTQAATNFFDLAVRAVSKKQDVEIDKFEQCKLDLKKVRPHLVNKWKQFADRTWKPDHLIWGPLAKARELGDEAYAQQAEELLKQWSAEDSKLNNAVRKAISTQQPKTVQALVSVYDQLFQPIGKAYREAGYDVKCVEQFKGPEGEIAKVLLGRFSPLVVDDNDVARSIFTSERNTRKKMEGKIRAHEIDAAGSPPRAMAVKDRDRFHDPVIYLRGDPGRRGDQVKRQFLRVLNEPEASSYSNGSGRLELARDIVANDNPLTRRVIANRVWMGHFDQPLVLTPGDFGIRSDPPTHPLLLDHLASYLSKNDWSLKKLHKHIMLSATYQQSSEDRTDARAKDPENRLLWKMNRRRLTFEEIRDGILEISGKLDTKLGGRAVKILQDPYPPRRTVYGFVDRQDLPNLYRVFDFPSPDATSPQRSKTSVPQQALYLLNNDFVQRQAQLLTEEWENDPRIKDQEKLSRLFQAILQRDPKPEEVNAFLGYVDRSLESVDERTWMAYNRLLNRAHDQVWQLRFHRLPEQKERTALHAALRPVMKKWSDDWTAWDSVAQVLLVSNEFMFVD